MDKGTYIVTGANGGIGSAAAAQLKSLGLRVALLGRNEKELSNVSDSLDIPSYSVNLENFDEVSEVFDNIETQLGHISGVAHCVGSILLKPAHLLRQEELNEVFAANVVSAFAVLRAGVKNMLANKTAGSFCFFSSAAAQIGLANHEPISAAKGAVEGMVKAAAATYASAGIRVNAVAPGLTETKLAERITSNQKARETSISMHPLGRLGQAEEVARAAVWLLNPEQSWVTGQILGVDGGLASLKTLRS